MITASNWRAVAKGALLGFLDLELQPSGLILRGCSVMETHGRRWIGLPAKPQIDAEGRHRKDPKTGKPAYSPCVEIADKDARARFQEAALAAVDLLLDDKSRPSGERGFGTREVGVARTHPSARPSAFGPAPRRPRPATEPLADDRLDDLWRGAGGAP